MSEAPPVHSPSPRRTALATGAGLVLLLVAGAVAPRWLTSLATLALANGLVSLGIVVMMRCGAVPFGQGLVFAAGGYAAALLFNKAGITDIVLLSALGALAGCAIAAPFAPLLARYRGIFFAMLTLALSMVLYGLLMKTEPLGGSDGFNVGRATLLGWKPPDAAAHYVLWAVTATIACGLGGLMRIYFDSQRGLLSLGVRENELRVEYLGSSVTQIVAVNYLVAAALGGAGGALAVLALGHIDPNFSYWTTSGEFVFVAILAGHHSVVAVLASSFLLELVRSFSSAWFPNTWQLALGLFLLLVIRFLPDGLGSLLARLPVLPRRAA
ncbi:MAG TPA: branched-chain amino acid ABC transporter permease [Ramlibacter sp.]|uniref:branched-chain amino acid ABC transporter permease n=1 Tax=Ramlibacter sp. TaxID=1917967 RepID=UPI002D7F2213|nr:branched-chain amino acid ABC transporter permease [Ramlibacter sp.]HET8748421.1 branched-chain amino acid ABC transporter permease [Ramlibacter sp.]